MVTVKQLNSFVFLKFHLTHHLLQQWVHRKASETQLCFSLPWDVLETSTGIGSNSSSALLSEPGGSKPEIKQVESGEEANQQNGVDEYQEWWKIRNVCLDVGPVQLTDRDADFQVLTNSYLITEQWAIAPVVLRADPPDTGANSSRQGVGPEEKGLPKRESSPLWVSIAQKKR